MSISGRMLEQPAAFPFFSFPNTLFTPLSIGFQAILSFTSLCRTDSYTSSSYWLLRLSTLEKCLLQRCCWVFLLLHGTPSSSLMTAVLHESKPLCPHCISLIAFHTFFLPNLSPSISLALSFFWNQSFFVFLMALPSSTPCLPELAEVLHVPCPYPPGVSCNPSNKEWLECF